MYPNASGDAKHHSHSHDAVIRVYDASGNVIETRNGLRGVDLISDALPFGRLWYGDANAVANAISYAQLYSRSHDAVICVYGV